MGKEKDTKINHTVYNIEDVGQVQIADEVVAVIAGLAWQQKQMELPRCPGILRMRSLVSLE